MKLTDEQIASLLTKESKNKTVLVSLEDSDKIIKENIQDGWVLIKKTLLSDKCKITFKK